MLEVDVERSMENDTVPNPLANRGRGESMAAENQGPHREWTEIRPGRASRPVARINLCKLYKPPGTQFTTQFTCFTSKKLQTLTPEELLYLQGVTI